MNWVSGNNFGAVGRSVRSLISLVLAVTFLFPPGLYASSERTRQLPQAQAGTELPGAIPGFDAEPTPANEDSGIFELTELAQDFETVEADEALAEVRGTVDAPTEQYQRRRWREPGEPGFPTHALGPRTVREVDLAAPLIINQITQAVDALGIPPDKAVITLNQRGRLLSFRTKRLIGLLKMSRRFKHIMVFRQGKRKQARKNGYISREKVIAELVTRLHFKETILQKYPDLKRLVDEDKLNEAWAAQMVRRFCANIKAIVGIDRFSWSMFSMYLDDVTGIRRPLKQQLTDLGLGAVSGTVTAAAVIGSLTAAAAKDPSITSPELGALVQFLFSFFWGYWENANGARNTLGKGYRHDIRGYTATNSWYYLGRFTDSFATTMGVQIAARRGSGTSPWQFAGITAISCVAGLFSTALPRLWIARNARRGDGLDETDSKKHPTWVSSVLTHALSFTNKKIQTSALFAQSGIANVIYYTMAMSTIVYEIFRHFNGGREDRTDLIFKEFLAERKEAFWPVAEEYIREARGEDYASYEEVRHFIEDHVDGALPLGKKLKAKIVDNMSGAPSRWKINRELFKRRWIRDKEYLDAGMHTVRNSVAGAVNFVWAAGSTYRSLEIDEIYREFFKAHREEFKRVAREYLTATQKVEVEETWTENFIRGCLDEGAPIGADFRELLDREVKLPGFSDIRSYNRFFSETQEKVRKFTNHIAPKYGTDVAGMCAWEIYVRAMRPEEEEAYDKLKPEQFRDILPTL